MDVNFFIVSDLLRAFYGHLTNYIILKSKNILIIFTLFSSFAVSASYVPGAIPDSSRQRHAPLYGRLVSEEHLPAAHRDVHHQVRHASSSQLTLTYMIIRKSSPSRSNGQSVHPPHRQTFVRCKHEFPHTSEIRRWRLFGS